MDKDTFIKSLSPEFIEYFNKIEKASELAELVIAKYPEFDRSDIMRIILLHEESYESRLATGLRRRVIGHV